MKYRELIQFEPINEVVKFSRLEEEDYRKGLVRNFVFSRDYEQTIIPRICENLDYTQTYRPFQKDLFSSFDTFGLQIVGNYGTGKSHLMSLVSLVAENEEYLGLISNINAKDALSAIAGKYKIIRFELGNDQELWDIICYQIDKKRAEEDKDDAHKVHKGADPARVIKEGTRNQGDDGDLCAAGHKGG